MEDQEVSGKGNTVSALLLQALLLMVLSIINFIDSLTPSGPPTTGLAFLASIYFGIASAIAFFLTFRHHRSHVQKRTLQTWATVHIALSFFAFIQAIQTPVSIPMDIFIEFVFGLTVYFVPPVLIHVFAGRERT